MRQLATSTLSNQNISNDLLIYTYTADAARTVLFRVAIDQVAGDGDYSFYLTMQPLGAGSFYKSHVATVTAAAGVTAIMSPTIPLPVNNTDIVRIYTRGLAGDTLTPDITTWVFEQVYGEQVDLVDAPNATAVTAIQAGLAVPGDEMDLVDAPNATAVTAIQAGLAVPGDEMVLTTGERTNIAAAVWNALTSAMTTVGSIGKLLAEKVALIVSGSSITVSSPVLSNGSVETIQGDDYLAEDGRALSWTVSSSATLTGGVATAVIKGVASFTATIVSETLIRLELTRAQSATINAGYHGYSLFVTQTDGDKITLARGTWHSSAAHTA